jgi:hypothetical protein
MNTFNSYFKKYYGWAISISGFLFLILFIGPALQEYNQSSFEISFKWLKDKLLTGDVFISDPNVHCGTLEDWDYLSRKYFSIPLTFVQNPYPYRRVWYVSDEGNQDIELQTALQESRIIGPSFGSPDCSFRLYEAPPDSTGILFENGMRFHGIDVMRGGLPWTAPFAFHEGETAHLRIWWTIDQPLSLDYSVETLLIKSDYTRFAELNAYPQIIYPQSAVQQTSQWQPGQFYIEQRDLTLLYPTARGSYRIVLAINFDQEEKHVPAPGIDDKGFLRLQLLTVMSY